MNSLAGCTQRHIFTHIFYIIDELIVWMALDISCTQRHISIHIFYKCMFAFVCGEGICVFIYASTGLLMCARVGIFLHSVTVVFFGRFITILVHLHNLLVSYIYKIIFFVTCN